MALLCCCVGLASGEVESSGGCDAALYVPPPYAGTVLFGSTQGTPGFDNKCSSSSSEDGGTHFYIITPDSGSRVNVTTCHADTTFDTFLAVYTGDDCNHLSCVAYNDDSCSSSSSFVSFVASAEEYWIMVSGYSTHEGEYELSIYEEVQQPVNGCQEAVTIHGPFYQPVTLYDSIEELPLEPIPCSVSSNNGGNWYMIYPSLNSNVTVTTCTQNGVSLDTIVAVFQGDSCSDLSCLVSNDDHCTYYSLLSTVTFVARSPMYYVYVAGYGSATGGYYLTIAEEAGHISPPTFSYGTNCDNAVTIHSTGTSTTYNTANGEVYNYLCGLNTVSPSFWFKFTPSHTDTYVFSTCNASTNFDTVIAVMSGDCDDLTCEATNDDSSCSTNSVASTVAPSLTSGRTYYIAVAGYSGHAGDFELTVARD